MAPVERWCAAAKQNLSDKVPPDKIAGFIVAIETESMRPSVDCDGKSWLVDAEQATTARTQFGLVPSMDRLRVCEHMLEKD